MIARVVFLRNDVDYLNCSSETTDFNFSFAVSNFKSESFLRMLNICLATVVYFHVCQSYCHQ